jgi:DNA-nicking Smr family endonuclease
MTRRRLTPEEIELWHRVAQKAERLHPLGPALPRILPKPKPVKRPAPRPETSLERFETGQHLRIRPGRDDLKPGLADRLAAAPVRMDRKAFGRMKRGKLSPEARIDLHGMVLDRAHAALTRFILSSQASGRRLVLVITGKGKAGGDFGPIPTPRRVLKHQVPHWLALPPLAQAVLQVSAAHISHGGAGAYYVYLRKPR